MKILIYSDNIEFLKLVKKYLDEKYTIITAGTFYMAKEYVINNDLELIIIEIKKEGENNSGFEFLKIIKASALSIPVIVLAAKADVSIAVECLKLGAEDFIEKSNEITNTAELIANSINKNVELNRRNKKSDSNKTLNLKILFIDDNRDFTNSINFHFSRKYEINVLNDFSTAKNGISQKEYDCIFLDIKDEVNNDPRAGVKLLEHIMNSNQNVPVIMLSGWAETATAVECLKLGAKDFLEKSLKINDTIEIIENKINELFKEKEKTSSTAEAGSSGPRYRVIDIIGESSRICNMRREIIKIANDSVPVLVYGETGTGKEMVASALHVASSRKENNFIEINCGSIPQEIFESELFGYTKGAFTGAVANRKGKIESADKGTLFLDEIENLSLEQQAKLLRVIEDRKIYPLGSNEGRIVDFRLICATNVDLQDMVGKGKFREDLFYRLNVYYITLPPLRERGEEDIVLLIKHFIRDYENKSIEKEALEILKKYSWPGNVRELKNLLKKFEIIARGKKGYIITTDVVKEGFSRYKNNNKLAFLLNDLVEYYNGNVPSMVKDFEDIAITEAYRDLNGNITKIAQKIYSESPDDNRNHREKVRKVLERNKILETDIS